jgi:HD-GYP domain-containing protein (c-di-GMP phosphodiesterase class II)
MKLVAINLKNLPPPGTGLPFPLYDETGRMLWKAGAKLTDERQRRQLLKKPLFTEPQYCAGWQRRMNAAMDQRLREGAALKDVIAAQAEDKPRQATAPSRSTGDAWYELRNRLDALLRDVGPGNDWLSRLGALHMLGRELMQRCADESLFHLVYEGAHSTERYSAHHAWMTLVIAEQAATLLGWSPSQIDCLGRAALTMNVAMARLQDQLAGSLKPLTEEQQLKTRSHAERGAALLAAAGLDDAVAVEAVRLHHDASAEGPPLQEQSPARQVARLLRRADIFGATISLRGSRPAMSPLAAARVAFLAPDGQPDEVGGALLRAVGLYPPGSFVALASGEVGIVVARGRRANLPLVAALVAASGTVYSEPLPRNTLDGRYAVKTAVPPEQVKVRFQHDKVLALVSGALSAASPAAIGGR